jgi:hypothetical protein
MPDTEATLELSSLQMFACIDVNQDGCISSGELQDALLQGQMRFDRGTVADLLIACTPDGSGKVNRANFEIFQKLLYQLLSQLRSLFGQFQCDCLSHAQVEQALSQYGAYEYYAYIVLQHP